MARDGYDPVYGARGRCAVFPHEVETRIGRALLSGDIHDGAAIILDANNGELVVDWSNEPTSAQAELARAGG